MRKRERARARGAGPPRAAGAPRRPPARATARYSTVALACADEARPVGIQPPSIQRPHLYTSGRSSPLAHSHRAARAWGVALAVYLALSLSLAGHTRARHRNREAPTRSLSYAQQTHQMRSNTHDARAIGVAQPCRLRRQRLLVRAHHPKKDTVCARPAPEYESSWRWRTRAQSAVRRVSWEVGPRRRPPRRAALSCAARSGPRICAAAPESGQSGRSRGEVASPPRPRRRR